MYTRSYNRNRDSRYQRYTPPPGYVGTAFSDESGVKHHAPDRELSFERTRDETYGEIRGDNEDEVRGILDCRDETQSDLPEQEKLHEDAKNGDPSPLAALIESLRGKLGAEELIILMTMFLISSDGICVEVLILALILIAGNEREH